jgi:hypothetical protein
MAFDWYLRRRYSFLLLALGLLLVAHPVAREVVFGRWLFDLFTTLVFLAAILTIFRRGAHRGVALLLGLPTLAATWTGYVIPGLPPLALALPLHVTAALFLGFTAATILLMIHEAKAVSADSLAGAFSGYLLAGVVFGHVYCILAWVAPGSFRVPADLATSMADAERRHTLLNYFSFVTLTTVGYGDIVPVKAAARALAVVEAVTGQFYIAVVMAELIGLKVSRPGGGPRPGAE